MPVEKGDFVLLDYIAMVEEGEGEFKVFDTTIREEGEKAGLDISRYGPVLVIVGKNEGIVLPPVEEQLVGLEAGEWKTIELPPEKAFGKRDPSKIFTISARELSRQGVVARVGEQVEFVDKSGRRQRGRVIFVGGGRVIIDTNHPYAGRKVVYKVRVVRILKTLEERVGGLVERWLGTTEGIEYSVADGKATIVLPREMLLARNIGPSIAGLARDIERYLPEVKGLDVVFRFEFERKEEAKEGTPQQEKGEAPEGS